MNIQPTGFTKNHIINNNVHLSAADELSMKKRREDLSRRPSYKRILNDLTSLSSDHLQPPIIAGQLAPPVATNCNPSVTSGNNNNPHQPSTSPSPQALDLLNSVTPVAEPQTIPSAQLVQYQQQLQHSNQHHPQHSHHQQQQQQHPHPHQHQHAHLPSNHLQQDHHHHHTQLQPPTQQHQQQQQQQQQPPQQLATHHQLNHPTTIHQLQTAASPPMTGSGIVVVEQDNKKRELRLQKNREAAKECRRKKKEYIKCLENRVALLETQNKALIDELKTLKDLYNPTK